MKFAVTLAILAGLTKADDTVECYNGIYGQGMDKDARTPTFDCEYCFNGFVQFGNGREEFLGQTKCLKKDTLYLYQIADVQPKTGCYTKDDPELVNTLQENFRKNFMYMCFCREGDLCPQSKCYGPTDCPIPSEEVGVEEVKFIQE